MYIFFIYVNFNKVDFDKKQDNDLLFSPKKLKTV